jgi:hypothetical protein
MGAGGGSGNDFSDGAASEVTGLVLSSNLYWNGGQPIPAGDQVNPNTADAARVVADPGLGSQAGLVLPAWTGTAFPSGSASIRDEFVRLVALYGTPAATGPAVDAADPNHAPGDDILGNPRTNPDLGAVEVNPASLSERLYLTLIRR